MDVKNAYIFNGGSILETEWAQYGTLLNVSNQYKIATVSLNNYFWKKITNKINAILL